MEVVAAKALKPSLQTEFIIPQEFCDEFFCFNANNIVVAEDFSVDDLLDFPNGEEIHHYEEEEDEEKNSTTSRDRTEDDTNSNSTAAADADADDSVFAGELSVPADDVADLEWVSHFVDDSLPELSLLYPVRSEQARVRSEPEPRPGSTKAHLHSSAIPSKPRTQKTRKPRDGVWSFNAASLCSSVLTSSVSSVDFSAPPVKKQKKRGEAQTGGAQFQRRCSHCQVQKTPQWRTGPLGPKTLCNACGVRFKSGRLFPEYRPACSPTFSGDVHSNSHRKVLEIRRRKETAGPATDSDRTEVVPGC